MPTCRFCHESGTEDGMTKYGTRHYAHFACYLDAGKPLSDLRPWRVRLFPWKVLKERNLLDEANRLTAEAA